MFYLILTVVSLLQLCESTYLPYNDFIFLSFFFCVVRFEIFLHDAKWKLIIGFVEAKTKVNFRVFHFLLLGLLSIKCIIYNQMYFFRKK